jgi:tripartite-type tricarboxylate transporter receptor subunit TctC
MRQLRSYLILFAAIAGVSVATVALCKAQTSPAGPVQLVVAFPPGGVGDLVARIIADKLAGTLGQSVTVENRPGGTGAIGAQSIARAAPDGRTLLLGQTPEIVVHRALVGDVGYLANKDLQPVALVAVIPLVLAARSDAPYASVDELLKAARASPRGLLFGSGGPGTPGHLAGELLRSRTGARLSHVPFEGGGPALEGLLNRRVDFSFPVLLTALPQITAGQAKALAVTSAKRSPALPNVPTLSEAGVKDVDVSHWVGIFAPAGTPGEIVTKLNQAINQILAQPEVRDRLVGSGAEVTPMSADQFAGFVRSEASKYVLLITREFCSRPLYGGCVGFPTD